MTVIFFGSSQYCLPVLESLHKNFYLKLVVTRPDKPVGRKQILTPSATKVWAIKNKIRVSDSGLGQNDNCDLAIVADYGRIIPEVEFNRPKLGTFNIHFSLLPKWRGASPVQAALLSGERQTGITVFQIEKTLDTGPILWQKSYPIKSSETAGDLYTRLFQEVAKELSNINFAGKLIPQKGNPTFCKKLTKDDGFIDWADIENPKNFNKYRAYYPWPGTWTINGGRRMKILKCHLEKNKLVLDVVQFAGEKPQKFSAKLLS